MECAFNPPLVCWQVVTVETGGLQALSLHKLKGKARVLIVSDAREVFGSSCALLLLPITKEIVALT